MLYNILCDITYYVQRTHIFKGHKHGKVYATYICCIIVYTKYTGRLEEHINDHTTFNWFQKVVHLLSRINCFMAPPGLTPVKWSRRLPLFLVWTNSWWYLTSYHRVICNDLLRICPLPTRWPPQYGALHMCGTARIFRLEHNISMKSTSTMLNPSRSAA